jgi:hypothetical protein
MREHTGISRRIELAENGAVVVSAVLAAAPLEVGVVTGRDLRRVNLELHRLLQRVNGAAVDAVLDDLWSSNGHSGEHAWSSNVHSGEHVCERAATGNIWVFFIGLGRTLGRVNPQTVPHA